MNAALLDEVRRMTRAALDEDIGDHDVTTQATVPEDAKITANMVARETLVPAGLKIAESVFKQLDDRIQVEHLVRDGHAVPINQVLLRISGPARGILTAERTALNFVQRLSGVATLTSHYVKAIAGTKAKILDTRKTTPGWRRLEKYAVTCGGGKNHRVGLYDMILIKDNHLAALKGEKPNAIGAAVQRAREKYPHLKVEVETDTLDQVKEAVEAKADIILFDNMKPDQLRQAVAMVAGQASTEASGGVNLHTIRAIAETGVDYISVGALTHSAKSVDIALDFIS